MHCGECKWWHRNQAYVEAGDCRRYPPSVQTQVSCNQSWPSAFVGDFCGEFKRKDRDDGSRPTQPEYLG